MQIATGHQQPHEHDSHADTDTNDKLTNCCQITIRETSHSSIGFPSGTGSWRGKPACPANLTDVP